MNRNVKWGWAGLCVAAALFLAGCQSQVEIAPVETPLPPTQPVLAPPPAAADNLEEVIAQSCTVTSPAEGAQTQTSAYPGVRQTDLVFGPDSAPVTLVEYTNFLCGHCAALDITLSDLRSAYPADLRIVMRHYPFRGQDTVVLAAQAVEAAARQDIEKAYLLKSYLFRSPGEWKDLPLNQLQSWLGEQAETLELDRARFLDDLNSEAVQQKVLDDQAEARSLNIPGTPFVIINGKAYAGPRDYASLETIINLNKLEELQFSECPAPQIKAGRSYTATFHTSKGDVLVELYPDQAPAAVNNFVFLARGGWYNETIFHRVIPGVIAQGGDPSGTGYGNPGYAFADEIGTLTFDQPGMLAMANSGPNTNGSQFFINTSPQPDFNGKYPIFGRVVQGLDVVKSLAPRDPSAGAPLSDADRILSITIEEQ